MHNSIFYLLSSSLIPELCTYITAGTPCNIELTLILVAAVRANPVKLGSLFLYLYLSVITALLAVVGLGIKLRIHYIIVNISKEAQYSLYVILKIRYFYIADSFSRRKLLKIRLKLKLGKGIELVTRIARAKTSCSA